MFNITNVTDGQPDYLLGMDKGQPVMVPALSVILIQANDTLRKAYNGKILNMNGAFTLTAANDLGIFSCIILPPASGVVTLTPVNGVTFNGSTGSVTRALSDNPAGFAIIPRGNNDYLVGGA